MMQFNGGGEITDQMESEFWDNRPVGLETKNDCTGKGQQQSTELVDHLNSALSIDVVVRYWLCGISPTDSAGVTNIERYLLQIPAAHIHQFLGTNASILLMSPELSSCVYNMMFMIHAPYYVHQFIHILNSWKHSVYSM